MKACILPKWIFKVGGSRDNREGRLIIKGQWQGQLFKGIGLCSRSARVPQETTFHLGVTGKTYFVHISLSAGHTGFHG